MSYLLDTNFVIGLLRGASAYWDYLDKLVDETAPAISAITRSEIFAGCHPHEERATTNLLGRFEAIAIQSSIADLAGRYVYQYRKGGLMINLEDALIGSTAALEGLVLVTRNVGHFPMLMLGHNLFRFPD